MFSITSDSFLHNAANQNFLHNATNQNLTFTLLKVSADTRFAIEKPTDEKGQEMRRAHET